MNAQNVEPNYGRRWYVVRTVERRLGMNAIPEKRFPGTGIHRIAAAIRALGFDVMVPTEYKRIMGPKRTRIYVQVPVFREYLFVNFDREVPGWPAIKRVEGVHCLMPKFAERPLPVPRGMAEAIDAKFAEERRLHDANLTDVVKRAAKFAKGQEVRVPEGASKLFYEAFGSVEGASPDWVDMLISRLGGDELDPPRKVRISADLVEAAA